MSGTGSCIMTVLSIHTAALRRRFMRPQAIYETAGDEEMVRFLETAGEAEETELLSDEKMDLLKKRQKELWNYIDGFSGQMLEQFAPVFERIPEWTFNLIEYDFSRKSE